MDYIKSRLNREIKKLDIVFKLIKSDDPEFKYAYSYYLDAKYFLSLGRYEEAYDLTSYVWGILDTLARKKYIEVPKEIKKWFKIDQE
jgi:hypothetical protein